MLNKIVAVVIRIYQNTLSPDHSFWAKYLRPFGHCRYYPTCSNYALQAFITHSFFQAFSLSLKRVLRCHPWSPGGFDHVPKNKVI